MSGIESIRSLLPDAATDIKLTLQTVFQSQALTLAQRWGVAIASALSARNPRLSEAVLFDARREVRGVEARGIRKVQDVHALPGEQSRVPGFAPGIAGEILVRTELERVDEDRDDDEGRMSLREAHERQVPLMQGSHRRDEPDRLSH